MLKLSGQQFSSQTLGRIEAAIAVDPSITRSALARQVCEWLEWRSTNGKLKEGSCRKALAELHRRGHVTLPACKRPAGFARVARQERVSPAIPDIRCSLAELGEIQVVPITSRHSKASGVWSDLMEAFHYLGAGPLCGAQIRYLIESSEHGWLGGLSFNSATWRLKDRDRWIQWSDRARRAHLERVVCNSRFLILPSVEVPHLASHVLGRSVARLRDDWKEKYGYAPVLCETFVDETRFEGTCYRAANWTRIGQTAGRSTGFGNGTVSTGRKAIYVLPLQRTYRHTLRQEPELPPVPEPVSEAPGDWIEEEFGGVELEDPRLKKRLFTLARDFCQKPGEQVPQACGGSMAKTKAAYRFFDNPLVDMKTVLRGHLGATIGRVRKHSVVLAVQDTSTLNYTAAEQAQGFGPINTRLDKAKGLILHDTMAFSRQGTPLGLLDLQCWAREPSEAGKRDRRKELPIEEKESLKWLTSYRAVAEAQRVCPETMLVSVGDREADMHELFVEAQSTEKGPELLIRADRGRNRIIENAEHRHLWEQMPTEPVAGESKVVIPRSGSRKARTACLEVRYAKVTLQPPVRKKKLPSVKIWAVYAVEVGSGPEVKEPLEWMLLTTVGVSSFEEALERLEWYTVRWGIEVYHRTLKSGCRIETRRLADADRLEVCLAIDLVVAWRIFTLTRQSRETPDVPCDEFLSESEWKVLYAVTREKPPPQEPPPLREAVRLIAKLGGFLGRKGDKEPGNTVLWRGLGRLEDMVIAFNVAESLQQQRAGP